MKYAQINSVPYGSTGNVMFQTQRQRQEAGDECWAMWGRGRAAENDHEFNYGTKAGFYLDVLQTRLDDRAGFHSKRATRRLLAKLDEIDPDIVHLHNLHGYHLNIEMLFGWLAARNQQTLWTLHDCWAFTGHCAYFLPIGCDKWKTGACQGACPEQHEYPKTWLKGASARNYADKRRIFTMLPPDKLAFIAPSRWLAGLVGESFLSAYPVEVRYNEIDREVFKPTPGAVRERYGIGDRFMVLGVASPWTEKKGLGDFIRLAQELDDSFRIVMIGLSSQQMASLPKNIIGIGRTESKEELAAAYTAADVFFNPTQADNYPTVNLEAEACGTPVITYDVGGCAETVHDAESVVVSDFNTAYNIIRRRAARERGGDKR